MVIRAPRRPPRTAAPRAVHYPETDGQPLGETESHAGCMRKLTEMLEAHFADDPDVWVNNNIMLYYAEGDPRRVVSPDVYVVLGVPKLPPRRIYALWVEGKAPTVVFEITSRKTRREDTGVKRELYRRLGVKEYVLFDTLEEYLRPSLQLLRLVDGDYEPVAPNTEGRYPSAALGLELGRRGLRLGLYDPRTGRWLRDLREAEAARREEAAARYDAEAARREEAAARYNAEAEIARLRAELARLRSDQPR